MSEHAHGAVSTEELLARLEALTQRLDEQQATITHLTAVSTTAEERPPATTVTPPASPRNRRSALRGLLAAGAAVGALAVAKAEPAHAGTRTTVFADNTASYGAAITYPAGTDPTGFLPPLAGFTVGLIASSVSTAKSPTRDTMLLGTANTLTGVQGLSRSADGVHGESDTAYGVHGVTSGNAAQGVAGVFGSSTNAFGVRGISSSSYGVVANSTSSIGLVASNTGGQPGVYGQSNTGAGVYGTSNNHGVWGVSVDGYGIHGNSNNSIGVVGTTSNGQPGVYGSSLNGAGIFGTRTGAGLAALFVGPVVVQGAFTVSGGPKSAAVKGKDGKNRRVYCQESPEPWFEDVGGGQLQGGKARIDLDPEFAAIVNANEYHVFLTPGADTKGLFVTNKTATGFAVQEVQGGTVSIPFSYRVMARRRDDVGKRLEEVNLGEPAKLVNLPHPEKVVIPAPPEPPKGKPEERKR